MNPDLQRLQPYPFQKLAKLFGEVTAECRAETDQPAYWRTQACHTAVHQRCPYCRNGWTGELSHNHRQRRVAHDYRQLAGTPLWYSSTGCEDANPASERQSRGICSLSHKQLSTAARTTLLSSAPTPSIKYTKVRHSWQAPLPTSLILCRKTISH